MDRRRFIRTAAGLLGLRPRVAVADAGGGPLGFYRAYNKTWLMKSPRQPLKASRLVPFENYLFFYPYTETPCFLLDLKEEIGAVEVRAPALHGVYTWPGGVGRRRSVVAYTSICAHLWSHPERDLSVIAYHGPGHEAEVCPGDRRITCCAHGSCFDPAAGGAVLDGPTQIPLAAVDLRWEEKTDELVAWGIWGRDSFQEFFTSFPAKDRTEVKGQTSVVLLRDYCKFVVTC